MEQPITLEDGTLTCPECGEELAGNGKNAWECMNCDYHIHELEIED